MLPAARAARYGLVAAYNLTEVSDGSGAVTRNDAYSTNHLDDTNTVTNATSPRGLVCAQFTSANSEYLSIADNAPLSMGDVDMWVATWALFDATPGGFNPGLVTKWTAAENEFLLDYDHGGPRFRFTVRNTANSASTTVNSVTFGGASAGVWYFIMGYHDAVNDVVKVGVNAGAFDSQATTGGVRNGAAAFAIGARATPGSYQNGRIGPTYVGKSPPLGIAALASEIAAYLYAGGLSRLYPAGWS